MHNIPKSYNDQLYSWLRSFGIEPNNLFYYVQAMTHRSYSNEHKQSYDYEKLEFLGDSVIGFLTTEYLYNKYKNENEGFLTQQKIQMVQSKTLCAAAKKINIQNFVLLGVGMKNNQDIDKILEDVFEALIAAIYLDLGIASSRNLLFQTLFKLEDRKLLNNVIDYKSLIQIALVKHDGKKPLYFVTQNPDNMYEAKLIVDGIHYGKGIGKNRKEAEKAAAASAYKKLVGNNK